MNSTIQANHDPLVDLKEITFNFRRTKDDSGVEYKRESVVVPMQIPSVEGIVKILETGGKELQLLQDAVESVLVGHVRSMLSDDTSLTTENFPADTVTWTTIANLPDTDRRGRGIPKELWDEFIESYLEVMPGVIGRPLETVKRQAAHLANKFQMLKTHEKKNELLPNFIEMLAIYSNAAPDADQYSAPIEFLIKKAEEFMQVDKSADLADNLGFD